jgi:allantoicase
MTAEPSFTRLPDLASRALAGSVVYANDELFAHRENLVNPSPARFAPDEFGPKGKVYDGWETRRRREAGHDFAIVRLGAPGVVRGVCIDTSWFTGNYPPQASVEATSLPGYPDPGDLVRAAWSSLVSRSGLAGDAENFFTVDDEHSFTHVRLSIYPDGGVARLRVYGEPTPDPRLLTGTVDLAALELGGFVVDCSDRFYSSPMQLLLPDRARSMADGWENARRRDTGNDHVTVRLAALGRVRRVEVDTSYFVGNAPGSVRLGGAAPGSPYDSEGWPALVPRTRLQPDTRHFFRVSPADPVTHVRLDVYPDGGVARLRVHGEVTDTALAAATVRWLERLPDRHCLHVLESDAGLGRDEADKLVAARPFGSADAVPGSVVQTILAG